MRRLFQYLKPFHKKAQVILFPQSKQHSSSNIGTNAAVRYVTELLRDKGYGVESILIDNEQFDIVIPSHHCMVYCSPRDKNDVYDIIYQKKLRKISHKNGYRFYVIHTSHFYKDMITVLTKLRFY